MITVADTSGLIAASDRNAPESPACRAVLQEAGTVIISPLVLAEVDHLAKARFGSHARTAIIDFVLAQAGQSRFQIPETGLEVLDTARMVQRQYESWTWTWTWLTRSTLPWLPSTGPTPCSPSTVATSARCAPSLRTNGSGSSPMTYSSASTSSGRISPAPPSLARHLRVPTAMVGACALRGYRGSSGRMNVRW